MQKAEGQGWSLFCGDYREVLADVTFNAGICDPPYGKRTHDGNDDVPNREADLRSYSCWTPDDVYAFVRFMSERCDGWLASMTSDDLITPYRDAYSDCKRMDFAPVPILQHRPRMGGDGPGSGTCYLMVSRPRERRFMSWGSLPCWYESSPDKTGIVNGAKPLALMRSIVRDYSRPGDLVVDATAGGATTLLAAVMEGRRAIGSEVNAQTHAKAFARLSKPFQAGLFVGTPTPATQIDLLQYPA